MKKSESSRFLSFTSIMFLLLLSGIDPHAISPRENIKILNLSFKEPFQIFDGLPVSAIAPRLMNDGEAWESWDYLFYFDNGYRLMCQFQITNQGPGKHRGIAIGLIVAPDGRVALLKNGRSRKNWTFDISSNSVNLSIAKHRLSIQHPYHRIHMENSRGRMEIEAISTLKPIAPGRIHYRDDKFYHLLFMAPRMKIKATIQFPGEPEVNLGEGQGFAIYSYSNKNDFKQASAWLRFTTFNESLNLIYWEMVYTRERRYQYVPFLLISRDRDILYLSSQPNRTYFGFHKDKEKPHYVIPSGLNLEAHSENISVRGSVRFKPRHRFDLLNWIDSGVVRFLVKRSTHPVQYLYESDYTFDIVLEGKTMHLKGAGFARMAILNKMPEAY